MSETLMTIFKNIFYKEDRSIGELKTLSTFSVWDCYGKNWSEKPPVVFRNIMLCAMYPIEIFCVGEIDENEKNHRRLDAFKPNGENKPYFLDLASGARTHGRFTFTREKTVGKLYYGESNKDQWKRIIYGSIVHTGCKKLVYKQMKYVVVDDEGKTHTGNPLDDKINGIHWETGDSHAKASGEIMKLLEISTVDENGNQIEVDYEIPIQFRASLRATKDSPGWVGKGTVAYNPKCDEMGIDLVIPLSSLKGNKPELGNYEGKILIGTVFEAEERNTKLGWMIWQWFAFETLEQDNIISKLISKCQKLSAAFNSIQNLAEILRVDQNEEQKELEQAGEEISSDSYKSPVLRIIKADRRGVLLLHPYVIERVNQGIQEMWINFAKSAGVRFYSLMAQPDESLAHYHVVQPDGNIVGQKVFCAGSLPEGEYIVYCNPMRHWGDIQLWENKHEGTYIGAMGTIAAPRKLLASLGRDTDGDFIQLIKSSKYPGMRETIANFDKPPTVAKFPKVALPGSLQEIAVRSMTDLTGVVASLLGRARAANAENMVLNIPPGGEQKEAKEMRIIEFLSQELQIAVDSLKSAYPNNKEGLDAVKKFLDGINAQAPWLKDFKDENCYKNRPCAVDDNAIDTVSRIVQLVNSYYKVPATFPDSSPKAYQSVLFGDVEYTKEQYDFALSERERYGQAMSKAEEVAKKEAGDDQNLKNLLTSKYKKEIANNFRTEKELIYDKTNSQGNKYSTESWVAAYWKAAHQAKTGTAGIVFSIFVDEIIEKLEKIDEKITYKVIEVFAVQYSDLKKIIWTGQRLQIRFMFQLKAGKERLCAEVKGGNTPNFIYLGIVAIKSLPGVVPGETRIMRVITNRVKNDDCVNVKLFDKDTKYHPDIQDYLDYPLNELLWPE
ncbi:hypothetical protein ACE1CD_15520 [Aerosakkonema sp. BLCC-F183]|uniref:hypothetical protein n=1 Tax=Aerosakkonema sp. BLCC-F183 TaxID=3342834 RepID=UPI0035BB42CA